MLKLLKWLGIAVGGLVCIVVCAIGIIVVLIGVMYVNFALEKEHLMELKVPDTDTVLQVYSKKSHPMLPEYHRRMIVLRPGSPDQEVEIWPDPVGRNILDVYAVSTSSGVKVRVLDPKRVASYEELRRPGVWTDPKQGTWFDEVVPYSSNASSETFTTSTHLGHFDTREMKWVPAP